MPSDDSDRDPNSDGDRDFGSTGGESPPSEPDSPTGSTAASDPPPDDPRSFGDRFGDGWGRALDDLPLAAVPLVAGLLDVDNVRRVLAFRDGVHFGVAFRFPSALPDLWSFVSVPNLGSGFHVSPALYLLPVLIPIQAALVAGLLGSVREILLTGGYDFSRNVRRYFAPVLVFVALVRLVGLAAFSVAAVVPVAPLLLLVLFPAFVVLSYLFYATPYLLVVADASVGEALSRSYAWAMAGGPYFSYGAGYLLFGAAVSVVATAVVVNLGALGVLVGVFATAPVALALTFATTEFVAERADADDATDLRRPT